MPERRENLPAVAPRRFAIGDVHGCSKTLRSMIRNVLRLKPADTLYLLGDYLDRGPDSKGVLDCLLELGAAGYHLQPLLGNHEDMALSAVYDAKARDLWYANSGQKTVAQFGAATPEEIPHRYLAFLAKLPRMLITEDYVFVHAGLDFSKRLPLRDTDPAFMIWQRDRHAQPEKLAGRTLVCGHTLTPLHEIRASLGLSVICLDNGCWSKEEPDFGNLVALNLDSRELLVQENCE